MWVTQAQIAGAFLHPFLPHLHTHNVRDASRFAQAIGCDIDKAPTWSGRYTPPSELTDEQLAIAVRMQSIPCIADEASCHYGRLTTRTRAPYGTTLLELHGVDGMYAARESLGTRYHAHVFADTLLARGHWLGEPLALWLSRPRGFPKRRWQLQAARALVAAVPDVYGLRSNARSMTT